MKFMIFTNAFPKDESFFVNHVTSKVCKRGHLFEFCNEIYTQDNLKKKIFILYLL